MSSWEKKIGVVAVVVLIAMVVAYFATAPKPTAAQAGSPMMGQGMPANAAAGQAAPGQVCSPVAAGPGGVATQEFGKKGARIEIVAALPITHGCHVQTEAQLKKAYEQHKSDVHLIIYDLFGKDGQKFVSGHGGMRALVLINGKSTFDLNGKKVKLEVVEGGSYVPADIVPIIEQELKKS